MNVTIDPQAAGWRDDGTESGLLHSMPQAGPLVFRSLRFGTAGTNAQWFRWESGGGATVVQTLRNLRGSDYGGHIQTVTCPAADFSFVKIKLSVYGRRFGVRWYYTSGQPTEPFVVVVDGKSYPVPFVQTEPITQQVVGTNDPLFTWICPDTLSDERHEIEIIFLGDRPAGVSRSWILYGVLLDSWAGYSAQMPGWPLFGPFAVTASWQSFAPVAPWDSQNIRIQRVFIYNTTAGALNVFLSTTSSDANIFWSRMGIPATGSEVLDLGPHGVLLAPLFVRGSAVGLNAFVTAQTL